MRNSSVAAIDIGGTHVTAGMVMLGAHPKAQIADVRPLDAAGTAEEILSTITRSLRTLDLTNAVGIALPGPFDYQAGIAWYRGVAKFEALYGRDLGLALATSLNVGAHTIRFIKDADGYAVGEWLTGAGDRAPRMALLTLGTGVGSSFLVNGEPYLGAEVPPLGDVYTLKHQDRSLEDYVSRRAIRRAFREASGKDLDVKEIAECARSGDPVAREILNTSMRWLGRLLGPTLRAFAPTLVVLGGSIAQSSDLLIPPLMEALSQEKITGPRVVAGSLLEQAPILGAAAIVARPAA